MRRCMERVNMKAEDDKDIEGSEAEDKKI
jgi:hypothetical protein